MKLITRQDWGARAVDSTKYKADKPRRICLHHTWRPTVEQWHGNATMRGIQDYHIDKNGWLDCGMHLLMAPDGTIWEGRPLGTLGAHCGGTPPRGAKTVFGNSGSIGIEVVGDYDATEPTPSLVLALSDLVNELCATYGIGAGLIFGHFECWTVPPKTCPGKHLSEAMGMGDRWRRSFPGK